MTWPDSPTSSHVGGTGLHRSDRSDCFEIGYWVRSDCTGRGIATAATSALVEAAFTHLGEATQIAIRMDQANGPAPPFRENWDLPWTTEEDHVVLAKGRTRRRLVWVRERMS